jgi:hypothetical protein
MPKKGKTRKNRGVKNAVISRVWAVPSETLGATGNTAKLLSGKAGNLVKGTINTVKGLGNIWVSHTNSAVSRVVRGSKKTRRSRR